MKWLKSIVVLIVLASGLMTSPTVRAVPFSDVVVTVTSNILGIPEDFTLTYISDYEVGISWTKGEDAVNTMIRASYNKIPDTITEGYLVYYGDGEYATDTTVNFEEYWGRMYYSAWSESAGGVFSSGYVSDEVEGINVILIFLGAFGGLFLVLAFVFRQMALSFFAGLIFLGLSIRGWANTTELYDVYWLIGLLGILALLVCFIMGFIIQHNAASERTLGQRRQDKEFPPSPVLTEEEAYSRELDREVDSSRKRRR